MDSALIIGSIGVLLIVVAFILNQLHKWKQDYLIYDLFNFFGGLFLYVYANNINSYPFIAFSIIWLLISFRDIVIDMYRNYNNDKRGFINKWLK